MPGRVRGLQGSNIEQNEQACTGILSRYVAEPIMIESRTKAPLDPSGLTLSSNCLQIPNGKALLDATPDAIVLVNQSRAIVLVNAQAEGLFGYGQDELIGKQAEILFSEHSRSHHNDQQSRAVD